MILLCLFLTKISASPVPTDESSDITDNAIDSEVDINQRALLFRPLFVYRQQQLNRQHVTMRPYPYRYKREALQNDESSTRDKRAIIFRPLFVYRQQELRRQKQTEAMKNKTRPSNNRYKRDLKPLNREKRVIIFRPLFVYRQQELKKQKIREERRKAMATPKPRTY